MDRRWELHEVNVCEPKELGCHPNVWTKEQMIGAVPSYDFNNCGQMKLENYFGVAPYNAEDGPNFDHHTYRGICGKGSLVSYVKDGGNRLEIWEKDTSKFLGNCKKQSGGNVISCGNSAAFRSLRVYDYYVCPFMC